MSTEKKKPSLGIAIIPVVFVVLLLMVAVLPVETAFGMEDFYMDAHMPLFFAAMFTAILAMKVLNFKWAELEEGIVETIKMSMGAIIILMIIGMVIGTWIISGIVPAMIFYGLQILSPGFFLAATLLICSVVALATGSSWTTAGTVGIALMGIGMGLGVPVPMTGGAIISGAYFGDKMSPLSDTTNLAPAMAGSNLFDHVRHMIFTTGPSYVISLILFAVIGMQFSGNQLDQALIDQMTLRLGEVFNLNPILLIAPVLVIAMVVMKTPAIPGLFGGALLGGIFAMMLQGTGFGDMMNAFHYGYEYSGLSEEVIAASANPDLVLQVEGVMGELLTRGGLDSMMWTISLILCAMIFGGVMERSGMLHVLAENILKLAHGVGGLVTATVFTCIFLNVIAGDQYLSIVIPGRMYKSAFDEAGLDPRNLSRALEDSGTLSSPLIPWNTCGATMIGFLGLTAWTYVPYCFLNLINPLVSIFYGWTGITMMKKQDAAA